MEDKRPPQKVFRPAGIETVSSTVIPTNEQRKDTTMFAKTLIAAAALTAVTAGFAATANAKVNVDLHIGAPGIYLGHGYYPAYYDGYYDDDACFWKKVKKVKWHNGHKHEIWKKKLVCY
jgi:hypothetical protein